MASFTPSSLLYQSPSPSSESVSLVDSEYVTAHEWSSTTTSCNSSPFNQALVVPPAPSPPLVGSPHSSDHSRWMPPADVTPVVKKPCRPETSGPKKNHVPRPPNAFMLFRSMMINTRIPKIENRQQNVSRIAGEIWNKLEEPVKQAWHDKAEQVQRQHKLKYPDYKFTPSRKASMKAKEDEESEGRNMDDYIRHLREKYMGVMGPAVAPARKRKAKSRRVKQEDNEYAPSKRPRTRYIPSEASSSSSLPSTSASAFSSVSLSAPSTLPPWRLPLPASMPFIPGASAYDYLLLAEEYHRYNAPAMTMPHEVTERAEPRHRQMSYYDSDKTPIVSSFGHISMPPALHSVPPPPVAGSLGTFQHGALGIGNLGVPHAGFYPSYTYPSVTPQYIEATIANTTTPSPSEGSGSDYSHFNFPEDIFANLPGCSGTASAGPSVSSPVEHKLSVPSSPLEPLDIPKLTTSGSVKKETTPTPA